MKHGLAEPVFEEFQHGFHVVIYKESASEGVNGGVNGLLAHIQSHPGQRASEISAVINIPLRTIERWLKDLRETGDIEFRGASKTGGYFAK